MNANPNLPISEQFRLAADDYADKDAAARLLEEMKTATLAEWVVMEGDKPVAHAERDVKSSEKWRDYIKKMVNARQAANRAKFHLKYLEMRFGEWNNSEANARSERRL